MQICFANKTMITKKYIKFESEKIKTNKDLIHQIINGNYSPVIINNP